MDESVGGAQTGAARWLCVHDDLLRGLTHALSNRVGSISAVSYLLEVQPASVVTSTAALREESERLDMLLQHVRLLPHRADAPAEPVVPTDTTSQAMALQSYHPDARDINTVVTLDGDLQAAYADPAALAMAVTVILGAAQRAIDGRGRVEITISCSTESVQITARGRRADGVLGEIDADTTRDVLAVNWLLAPFGGSGVAGNGGATVVIPTLQAARRAQRN